MALTNQLDNRDKMIMFGGLFGVFASISALCNRYLFILKFQSENIIIFQSCQSRNQNMAEELSPPLVGILLGSVGIVDHAHGTLAILPASSVETCISFLC